MEFDFYTQYKDYSNVELLKITKRPADYQTMAVTAAKDILSQRQVSPEEELTADRYYESIDAEVRNKAEKVNDIKSRLFDFFSPIIHPLEKFDAGKWMNIFLFLMALEYLSTLYTHAQHIYYWGLQLNYYKNFDLIDFLVTPSIFNLGLIFTPVLFYLLLRRKRWGWITLFFLSLSSAIMGLVYAYVFKGYADLFATKTFDYAPVIFQTALCFFLWRDSICTHFNISKKTKINVLIVVTVLSFVMITFVLLV